MTARAAASDLKSVGAIRSVESFLVSSGAAKQWVFVRIETTDGVLGWGECYTAPDREIAIRSLVGSLGVSLIGRPLAAIKHFATVAYRDFATLRGSFEFFSATSGIEQAMWDALGKTLGQPVYNLLGGPSRDRIRMYANGWSYGNYGEVADSGRVVEAARAVVAMGFTALKFDPFPGPWHAFPDNRDIGRAVDLVRTLRNELGPDVDLLIECHRRFAPMVGKQVAARLEPFRPFWLEEPVPSTNIQGLREVRASTSVPVVTGEEIYTKWGFADVFRARAADIVNPDVGSCGGVLSLLEIAAMADAHMVAVSPHNYNSTTIALAATLQAAAVMPNFLITEYFVNFIEPSRVILASPPFDIHDGYIEIPKGPGLGIELNEEAVRSGEMQPPARRFSAIHDETGPSDGRATTQAI